MSVILDFAKAFRIGGEPWITPERRYRFRQEELTWKQYGRRYIDLYG